MNRLDSYLLMDETDNVQKPREGAERRGAGRRWAWRRHLHHTTPEKAGS